MKLKGLEDVPELEKLRLKFGCTCGQCTSGFLSPRMRFALRCQADINHDLLAYDDIEDGEDFVSTISHLLDFVLPRVRQNLKTNKSMRQGFTNLFSYFARCVKDDDSRLPTEDNVLMILRCSAEWPPASRNFLERGGTVYAVGSMIFSPAMDADDLAGEGTDLDVFEEEIANLPECRNDCEFGFVSALCGYKRVSQIRYVSLRGEELDSD